MPPSTPRARRCHIYKLITPSTRGVLSGRRRSGQTYSTITRDKNLPISTIRDTILRSQRRKSRYRKPRSRRPHTLTTRSQRSLLRLIRL